MHSVSQQKRLRYQIVTRLTLTVACIGICYGIIVIFLEFQRRNTMFDKIDQYVAAVVSSRQDILASGIYLNHREAIPRIIEKIMTDPNIMEISIFDADGAPFYLTHPDNHKETRIHDEDATIRNPEITFSVLQEHFQGVRVRTYTFPLTVIDEPAGIFRLRYTVDTVFREAMLGILLFISLILTILVFLFILIYFAVTRFVVLPIEEMIRTLRRASDGELGEQVTIILNNEIGELATIFNIMSAKNAKMMTALRDTNRELKTARNYLHNIINSMPSALIGVDIDGRVTQWNVIAEKLTGTASSDARGKSLQTVFPRMATQLNIIQESIQTRKIRTAPKKPCQFDNHIRYEDITIYPLVANGVDGAVIRIDDITEKVRMEEMMIQSERMLSLGGLAAGMAHEINNPLSGMIQNAQVISNRLMDHIDMPANQKAALAQGLDIPAIGRFLVARKIPELVLGIIASGHRVSEIINNMLSFVRKTEGSFSSHSLEELCEKTLVLAASDFNTKKKYDFRKIQIFKSYGDPVPHVLCEASKIQQVLLNIFINGAYAMKTASTENPGFHVSTFFDDSRKMACLEIRDNGPGMDEPTRKRIFEPFFTTKPEGIGTGLGLSVSYFIITEYHLGDISVESAPGSGAAFLIRLPAVTPQTR